jgi:hypothetical protein
MWRDTAFNFVQLLTSNFIDAFVKHVILEKNVGVYYMQGLLSEFSCITLKMGTKLHAEMLEHLQHTTYLSSNYKDIKCLTH